MKKIFKKQENMMMAIYEDGKSFNARLYEKKNDLMVGTKNKFHYADEKEMIRELNKAGFYERHKRGSDDNEKLVEVWF